mgnify:CR=1 FL=1
MIGMNMTRLIFKICAFCAFCVTFVACEKPVIDGSTIESGNVTLTFEPTRKDYTRGTATTAFSKLNDQYRQTLSVMSTTGHYVINGQYTSEIPAEVEELVEEFTAVHDFRKYNFQP